MSFLPASGMEYERRSQVAASQSAAEIRVKLRMLASSHQQVKIVYQQLKSQIKIGLLQAEEVFASLAVPLMKLVGLKTTEMAEEGRFTTITSNSDSCLRGQKNMSESPVISPTVAADKNHNDQNHSIEGENFAGKATMLGRKFLEKQHMQLTQLVQILRQTETEVNSCHNDILQNLANHRVSLQKFFQRGIYYISALHSQNNDTSLIALKLLRTVFSNMNMVLGSVEGGIEDLIQALAGHMCGPMVDYVNSWKADMKIGSCACLMAIVEKMEKAMGDRRLELEEARKRVRVAEEGKMEALIKLKETEESLRRMKTWLGFLPESIKGPSEPGLVPKSLNLEKDHAHEDNLQWEPLKKRRKHQLPESPVGPHELQYFTRSKKQNKCRRGRPASRRVLPKNQPLLSPQPLSPYFSTWIPLGFSPSAANHHTVSDKPIEF